MKIYNEVTTIFNDDTGKWETISEDSYEHKGDISLLQEVDWSDVDLDMFSGDTPIGWTQESLQNLLDLPEGTNIIEYLSSKKKKLPKKVVPELIKEGGGVYWDWLFDPNLDTGGNWWDRLTETLYITDPDGDGDMTIEGTDQFNIEALMENPNLSDATRKEILEGIMGQWTSTENIDWNNISGIPSWQLANIFQDDELTGRYLQEKFKSYSSELGGVGYFPGSRDGEIIESGMTFDTTATAGPYEGYVSKDAPTDQGYLAAILGQDTSWLGLEGDALETKIEDIVWKFLQDNDRVGTNTRDSINMDINKPGFAESELHTYMQTMQKDFTAIQDYKSANVMDYDPSDWAEQIFGIEGRGGALGRIQDLYDKIGLTKGEISGIEDLIGSEEEGTGIYGDIALVEALKESQYGIIGDEFHGTGLAGDKARALAQEKYYQDLVGSEEVGSETGLYKDIIDEKAAIELEKQKKNVLARESFAGIRDYMSAYTQQGKAHRYGKATGAPVSADPTQGFLSGVYGDVGTYEAGLGRLEEGIGGMTENIYGAGGFEDLITKYNLEASDWGGTASGYQGDIDAIFSTILPGYDLDIADYQSQIGGYGIDIAGLSGDIADYRGESGIGGEYGWMQDFLYGGAGIADDPYDVLSAYGEGGASVLSDWLG